MSKEQQPDWNTIDAPETGAVRGASEAHRPPFASLPDAYRELDEPDGEPTAGRADLDRLPSVDDDTRPPSRSRGALWMGATALLIAMSGTGYSIWKLTAQESNLERVNEKVGELDAEQRAMAKDAAQSSEWFESTHAALESVQSSLASIRGNNAEMREHLEAMARRMAELEGRVTRGDQAMKTVLETVARQAEATAKPAKPTVTRAPVSSRPRPPELKLVSMVSYGPEVYVMVMAGDRKLERLRVGGEYRGWTLLEADPLSSSAVFSVAGERREIRL